MTDRIQHIIEEIRSKKNAVSNLLKIERENLAKANDLNVQLSEKLAQESSNIQTLQHSNELLSNDLASAKQEIQSLKEQLNMIVSEKISDPAIGKDAVQIDELVREIEYCIGQLKNNA